MELKSCFFFFKLVGSEGLKGRVKRNNSALSLHLASLYLHYFPCYTIIELFHGPLIYNLLSKWIESFVFLQGKERTVLLFICLCLSIDFSMGQWFTVENGITTFDMSLFGMHEDGFWGRASFWWPIFFRYYLCAAVQTIFRELFIALWDSHEY